MKKESSNVFIEYFEYFKTGIELFISEYPIITGLILFVLAIHFYLKMLEKKPIDYNAKPSTDETLHEIRIRGDLWMWIIFIGILGAYLIISNID